MLQVCANLAWLPNLLKGDVSSAFLQGRRRSVDEPLCLVQFPRGFPGLQPGQLCDVLKGLFGLADAPRDWFVEFSRVMTTEL